MPLDASDVKALAILVQALKPRRGSDELSYLEALHRWRHARSTALITLVPEDYKKLYTEECPLPTEPYTSRKPGAKPQSQKRQKAAPKPTSEVLKIQYAGYDPTERNDW